MTGVQIANEFKALFSKFNKGVRKCAVENGVLTVEVASRKGAMGVLRDLTLTRAFKDIGASLSADQSRFIITATVK